VALESMKMVSCVTKWSQWLYRVDYIPRTFNIFFYPEHFRFIVLWLLQEPPHDALFATWACRDDSPKQSQGDQLLHDLTQCVGVHRSRLRRLPKNQPVTVSATSMQASMVTNIFIIVVLLFLIDQNYAIVTMDINFWRSLLPAWFTAGCPEYLFILIFNVNPTEILIKRGTFFRTPCIKVYGKRVWFVI